MSSKLFVCILFVCFSCSLFAQRTEKINIDSTKIKKEKATPLDTIIKSRRPFEPLAPSKAAFYSAILPGLGQAYNRSYWKIPIVYAGLGTAGYAYMFNQKRYKEFRDIYKRRLAGYTDDQYYDIDGSGVVIGDPDISTDRLEDVQDSYQSNRDLSLLIFIGIYAINIIDANVDAHLKQFNINKDLSLKPYSEPSDFRSLPDVGLSLSFQF